MASASRSWLERSRGDVAAEWKVVGFDARLQLKLQRSRGDVAAECGRGFRYSADPLIVRLQLSRGDVAAE